MSAYTRIRSKLLRSLLVTSTRLATCYGFHRLLSLCLRFVLALNVQKSAGKLAGQYMDQDDDEPKKKRSRVVKTVRPSVMSQFCGVDSSTVTKAEIFSFYLLFL